MADNILKPIIVTAKGTPRTQVAPQIGTATLPKNFDPFKGKDMTFGQSTKGMAFGSLNAKQRTAIKANNPAPSTGQKLGGGQLPGKVGAIVQLAQLAGSTVGNLVGVDSAANITADEAKSLGVSSFAQVGNKLLEPFGLNSIAGKLGGTTNDFALTSEVQKLGQAYDIAALTAADKVAGKGALFGKSKMNSALKEARAKHETLTKIADQNNLAKMADPSYLTTQNQSLYSGQRPGLIANVEKGNKLKSAKALIKNWKLHSSKKYQLGGKMNLLPEGSLHAHKHHLENINPDLEGKITSKGIPVVSLDEGGNVVQQFAEIEKQEIVFTKEVTNQIEEFYRQYQETKDDNIAIECGKFIANQILHNTDDPEKTIKNA